MRRPSSNTRQTKTKPPGRTVLPLLEKAIGNDQTEENKPVRNTAETLKKAEEI